MSLLQVVSSVTRPVPLQSPWWYTATISVLDVIFLDTGGIINSECLNGDALAAEYKILIATVCVLLLVAVLQLKHLRPENLCFQKCCCEKLCCSDRSKRAVRDILISRVTPRLRMVLFHVVNFLYGVASTTALSLVICTGEPSYLRGRPYVKCYSASSGTLTLAVLSWVILATFTIPWPIMSARLVKRYYWKNFRKQGKNASARKRIVYDFWIADDNNLKPQYFWFRSVDTALLGGQLD